MKTKSKPIESLNIKGYQSHKNTTIRFHKGVNIFVGETDYGKSAIIKALRLAINNRPSGDEFISYWSDNTIIKTKVDGKVVKRKKGKENLYYIDKSKFQAFGQSIPEPVSKLFNISDVNIQHQLDTPFLLSESPGEVARYFNKIVNLDIIDRSLTNISNCLKGERKDFSTKKDERDKLKKSLKDYSWLIDAEDELRKLEQTQSSINKVSKQIEEISSLITTIERIEIDKEKLIKLTKAKSKVYKLIKLNKEISKENNNYNKLSEFIENVEKTKRDIQIKTREKKKLKMEFDKLMPDVCPLCLQKIR